jgi:nicotinamidase-related amidase
MSRNNVFLKRPPAKIWCDSGIITIVFAGIATEFGVESSARDALSRGFYFVVVSDIIS